MTQGPHPWAVFRGALAAAPARLAHDNFINYILLAIFAVIDGAIMRNDSYQDALNNPFPLTGLLGAPAFYFTLAAAMRLRKPGYAMRAVSVISLLVANVLIFIMTLAGALVFIVPGVWIGTRISLAPYVLALDGSAAGYATEALRTSWRLTEGRFWQTATLFLWQILFLALPLALLYAAAIEAFRSVHQSAYYFAPLLLLAGVFCVQVSNLAMLEWTAQLRAGRESLPVA